MARACACLYVCISKYMNSFTPKYTLVTLWPFVMQWMVRTENNANACLMKTCKQICKQANRKTSIGCDFEDPKRYKPNQTKTNPIHIVRVWAFQPDTRWSMKFLSTCLRNRYNHNGLMSKRKIASYMWFKKKTTINYGLATAHNKSHEF